MTHCQPHWSETKETKVTRTDVCWVIYVVQKWHKWGENHYVDILATFWQMWGCLLRSGWPKAPDSFCKSFMVTGYFIVGLSWVSSIFSVLSVAGCTTETSLRSHRQIIWIQPTFHIFVILLYHEMYQQFPWQWKSPSVQRKSNPAQVWGFNLLILSPFNF